MSAGKDYNSDVRREVLETIKQNGGVLFAKPALVGRHTYLGRDILALNSKLEAGYVDDRGYVPVEWWLCSTVMAGNPIEKENEGVASFFVGDPTSTKTVLFTDVLNVAEPEVLGKYRHAWPLIKVLDIGGSAISPNFNGEKGTEEVPPIPCHVHSGYICNGRCCGHGKLEAYFFPPLPKGKEVVGAKTRLGIKPNTAPETLVTCMCQFGVNDNMYTHLNEYEVSPFTGWTIACGCIHAPGPYLTFEVQLPQDDGNLLAWQLGKKIDGSKEELEEERERSMLKGCTNEAKLFEEVVNMNLTAEENFKEKWFRPSVVLEEGSWGRRLQTFFDRFYGEAIDLAPGGSYCIQPGPKPFSMVVWMGSGVVNGINVGADTESRREMLVCPEATVSIENSSSTDRLLLLSVYPFAPAVDNRSGIACAGLSCVDYVINGTGVLNRSTDHVVAKSFSRQVGGSVPNTSRIVASFENCRCEALTLIGTDSDGDLLMDYMEGRGVGVRYVARTNEASTQVAFLPVYESGERACIVVPGATSLLNRDSLLGEVGLGCRRIDMLRELLWFNLGYPYELKNLQKANLESMLSDLTQIEIAVSLDLNGAASSGLEENASAYICDALPHVALIHANFEEAVAFCASGNSSLPARLHEENACKDISIEDLKVLASHFLEQNVGMVAITLGKYGAFLQVNDDVHVVRARFGVAVPIEESVLTGWVKESCVIQNCISTDKAAEGGAVNTVGAGDAFIAGLLVGLESLANKDLKEARMKGSSLSDILHFAQMCAFEHVISQ
jgi:sugar/nucleoside kinase (ribokinase family)